MQNWMEGFQDSIDLMEACETLGLITGETAREDLVDTIFREFCMGK